MSRVVVLNSVTLDGDPSDPDRDITYLEEDITHRNLDTGYTLTEVDHVVFQFDAADSTFRTVGLQWHLRNADGKIVLVQAGLAIFDTDTGDVMKVTPSLNFDFAEVICPALGGSPSSR